MITEQSVSLLAVHQIKGGWRRGAVLPPPEASSAPLAVLRKKVSIKKGFSLNWTKGQTCERLSTLVVGRSVRVQQQLGQFVLELRVVHGHADRPHGARQHVLHLVVRVQHLNQQIKLSKLELLNGEFADLLDVVHGRGHCVLGQSRFSQSRLECSRRLFVRTQNLMQNQNVSISSNYLMGLQLVFRSTKERMEKQIFY